MSGNSATCITCHRVIEPDDSLGGNCAICLFAAGSTPELADCGTRTTEPARTTWANAFPQFEANQTLCHRSGFVALSGTVASDDFPNGHEAAVLLVWNGKALADEGGQDALLARAGTLKLARLPGLAPIVDAGDLAEAVYLIAKVPAGSRSLADETTKPEGIDDESTSTLESLLPALGRLIVSTRAACGVDLELNPALIFRDHEGGLCLVPQPIKSSQGLTETGGSVGGNSSALQLAPGLRLGDYSLVEKVGEGGFGEVWRSQQEYPVKREVALKILKLGVLASARMLARFQVEQEALARLDHPHVARFVEGGTTADSRPFFAMEWIDGNSITDFCNETNATLEQRLGLFHQVCKAVQHAHQKGIIHRDIKPSNVMVATKGNEPSVKVIDFGIARALEDPLEGETLLTRTNEIVGTPASMSPEQAAGAAGADLDARADVYGLGVLLYELLSESLPFDPKLRPDELRRHICEEDPEMPSQRTTNPTTSRLLKGDLDWIVMRCLEKDPNRRYESVAALSDDLDRFANDNPVAAGPPDIGYRTRKFFKRHRLGLAASGVVAVALIAGVTAAVFGLITAQQEQANAFRALETAKSEAAVSEAVNRFLAEELLTLNEADGLVVSDPRNHDIRLRTVLERAAARIDGRFDEMPEVEAVLRRTIAASFFATGDFGKAGEHAERAATLYESSLGKSDARALGAQRLLASIRTSEGKTDDALKILNRIASITGERPGGIPETLSKAESDILRADLIFEKGDPYAAAGGYASALRSEKLPPRLKAQALSGVARGLECCEPRADVLAEHQRAVVFAEKTFGKDDALTLEIVRRYALFLQHSSSATYEEVERFAKLIQEVIARQIRLQGNDHPATLRARFDYALANGVLEVLAPGALKEINEIVSSAETHYPEDHPELLRFRLGLAIQLGRGDDHQHAIEVLESIIESGIRSVGESHPVVVDATRELGEACLALGKEDEALAHFRTAVTRARTGLPATTPARQDAMVALGEQLSPMDGGTPELVEIFHDEYLACAKRLGPEHRLSARYLDHVLGNVEHDRTGGLAFAAAERAMQVGGTPAPTIRALLQLSLASQLGLHPSLFAHPTPPLPDAYFRLLVAESMDATMEKTGAPKTELPPQVLAPESEWRFLVIGEGKTLSPGWEDAAFDDTAWLSGAAPLGFGEPGLASDLRTGRGSGSPIISACFRHRFTASSASDSKPSLLRLRCDDGAVVYLNGEEVLRYNIPIDGALDTSTRALSPVEGRTRDFLIPAGSLVPGENLLAVRVFQQAATSSDIVFSAAIHADVPLPMQRLVHFEPDRAAAHLEKWLPGLAGTLADDWKAQAECMEMAMLNRWDSALARSREFAPASEEARARHQWFQRTALRRLGRHEEAARDFRSSIPKRNSSASPQLIDLTGHYNALVKEPWHVTSGGLGYEPFLKKFPVGTGVFGGITFDARGLLQLSSKGIENMGLVNDFTRAVEGIAIGQSVRKLHLLNATLMPDDRKVVVAHVVVHYADGEKDQFPLRYFHETLNYMVGSDPTPPEVRSGWRGPDPYRPGMDKELFIATWENPRPEIEVVSIDLRADGNADAALLVAGITVEPAQKVTPPPVLQAPVSYQVSQLRWHEDTNPGYQGLRVGSINRRGWAVGTVIRPAAAGEPAFYHGVINVALDGSGEATDKMVDLNTLFTPPEGWRISLGLHINEAGLVACELIPEDIPSRGKYMGKKVPVMIAVASFHPDGSPNTLTVVDGNSTQWSQRPWELNEKGDLLVYTGKTAGDKWKSRLFVNSAPIGDAPVYKETAIPQVTGRSPSFNSSREIGAVTNASGDHLLRYSIDEGTERSLFKVLGEWSISPHGIAEDGTVYADFSKNGITRPYRITNAGSTPLTDEDGSIGISGKIMRSMSRAGAGKEEVLLSIKSSGEYQIYQPDFGGRFVLPVAPGTIHWVTMSPPKGPIGDHGYFGGHIAYSTTDEVKKSFILTPVAP